MPKVQKNRPIWSHWIRERHKNRQSRISCNDDDDASAAAPKHQKKKKKKGKNGSWKNAQNFCCTSSNLQTLLRRCRNLLIAITASTFTQSKKMQWNNLEKVFKDSFELSNTWPFGYTCFKAVLGRDMSPFCKHFGLVIRHNKSLPTMSKAIIRQNELL